MVTRTRASRRTAWLAHSAMLCLIGASIAGCSSVASRIETTGSTSPAPTAAATPRSEADWRRAADSLAARYRANPRDARLALDYAQALRASGQRTQAAAVLEQASLNDPHNKAVLGAYGRSLADVGRLKQALDVLEKAHTPDQPDWRVLSAQGAVLDQMGRHQEAQRYYASALKIVPDEPSVLSNLGLSYALDKNLTDAESTLRRAAAVRSNDPRVRQNLALVIGLQGRFEDAESIARADLPADEASANVAYLRQMLSQHKTGKKLTGALGSTGS
jgi:Flp pilus assembly protein TadD